MTTHKGNAGVIKIGANTIAEVTEWELEEIGEVIEDTSMGDASRTFVAGLKSFRGSLSCWWDPSDATGQELLNIGESATLHLDPGGSATGLTYYEGTAIVENIKRGGAKEGSIVTAEISFQGSGTLTQGTN